METSRCRIALWSLPLLLHIDKNSLRFIALVQTYRCVSVNLLFLCGTTDNSSGEAGVVRDETVES